MTNLTRVLRLRGGGIIGALAACIIGYPGTVAAQPTVRFASSQFSHREMYTQVKIPIHVTGRDGNPLGITILAEAGTATPDEDFVPGQLTAHLFAEDSLQAFVRIYQDSAPEGPETVRLTIMDGYGLYEIGHPGEATLTIVDDDSIAVTAYFEIGEDIPLDPWGRIVVLAETGDATEVDVVIDELPPGGATIHYFSTVDDQVHALTFTDSPRQTIVMPPAAVPAGQAQVYSELLILNPPSAKATAAFGFGRGAVDYALIPLDAGECVCCTITFYSLLNRRTVDCEVLAEDCNYNCPVRAPAATAAPALVAARDMAADLAVLRRYRDEVLTGAPGGDYYIQLYTDHSPAIGLAILERPTLIHRVMAAWDLWLPAVAAQVDGLGAGFVITVDLQDALLGVMAELEELGPPDLAAVMGDLRDSLGLTGLAGSTAADLQSAIENNPMDVEATSWGGMKARFR